MAKVAVGGVAAAVLAMCLVSVPCTLCAQGVGSIAPNAFPRQVVASKLPTANGTQGIRIVTNALSDSDCTVGGGTTKLICFDNGAWTVIGVGGGGGGSDDQTASEVPITDTGGFYSGSDVESALQQVGGDARWTDARIPLLHTHTSAGITDFTSAVQGIGDARYTLLGHTHTSSSVTDFTTASQAVGDVRYSLLGHIHTSSSVTDFTTAVQSVGDARYSLLSHTHLLQDLGGTVTDLQVPNDITVDLAALATLATTATTANSGDTATGFFSLGTVEANRLPNLSDMNGAVTDTQVPNNVTISGTANRCARYDVSGNLVPSSGDCPSGDTTGATSPGGSNGQVQSNVGGSFGGDPGMTYDPLTDTLTIGGPVVVGGLVSLGGLTSSFPAVKPGTDRNGNLAVRATRGDDAGAASLVGYGLQLGTQSATSTTDHTLFVDSSRSEWTFGSSWLLGWSAASSNPFADADVALTRLSSGWLSLDNGRTSNGLGSLRVGAVRYVPVSSPPACLKGTVYYDLEDDDFCKCKGVGPTWVSEGSGSCS